MLNRLVILSAALLFLTSPALSDSSPKSKFRKAKKQAKSLLKKYGKAKTEAARKEKAELFEALPIQVRVPVLIRAMSKGKLPVREYSIDQLAQLKVPILASHFAVRSAADKSKAIRKQAHEMAVATD